jgi:hypothetical protein
MKINMKEMKEKVDWNNDLVVSELQMLADLVAEQNPKFQKYLDAMKIDDETLRALKFTEMNYKEFINEVLSKYLEDFQEDYKNLFIRNCAFIQICSQIANISSYDIKPDKIIFYAIIDGNQAYMEVEIIDILIGVLLLKDRAKVYDVIHRELVCASIKYEKK